MWNIFTLKDYFVVFLKFKLNWASRISPGNLMQMSAVPGYAVVTTKSESWHLRRAKF